VALPLLARTGCSGRPIVRDRQVQPGSFQHSVCYHRPVSVSLRRLLGAARGDLGSVFGPLEVRVLETLWRRDEASVRDLQGDFPDTAYTTLMTTLDRLHRKGMLDRLKAGGAFVYRPRFTPAELRSELVADVPGQLLDQDRRAVVPVLSYFVAAVYAPLAIRSWPSWASRARGCSCRTA
jgi:predicted transcriptional regulator